MVGEDELRVICKNIRFLRKKYGLSKAQMAKRLGIGICSLNMLERDVFPPRLGSSVLLRVSVSFGVRLSDVFKPLEKG